MIGHSWDAIVVGGGIAGSSAAIRLARLGKEVLILEKQKEAHDKVCGEFLSGECIPLLEEVGVDINDLGATEINSLGLRLGSSELQVELPFQARGVSRKVLDEALLEKAQSAGVEVKRGEHVKGIEEQNGGYFVESSSKMFFAKNLFWATGKSENTQVKRKGYTHVGYKRHLKLPRFLSDKIERTINLHIFQGGYCGLSSIEGGLFNFSALIEKTVVQSCQGDWYEILHHMAKDNMELREIFIQAEWQWERALTIGNIPHGHIYSAEDRFYVLGDQMAVIPPLAGDGMAMAMLSAKKAVHCFQSGQSIADYHSEMRKVFSSQMRWGGVLQKLFSQKRLSVFAMNFLRPFPRLTKKLVEKTRCLPI